MTARALLLVVCLSIAFVLAFAVIGAKAFAATCLLGSGAFTAPATDCTPGAYVRLTSAQVCAPKDRPSLPAAERRKILRRYGVRSWSGADGELDHRVPLFLGGTTDARNVWTERGSIPNPKDALEAYVRIRVCVRRDMTVRYARRLFLVDWRLAFRRYGLA